MDASTIIRWSGPPVGIVRVEAEMIRYALDHEPGAIISVYDTRSGEFRPLDPAVARKLIAGTAIVDVSLLPDPRPIERSAGDALVRRIGQSLRPLLTIGRTLCCAADEWRRGARSDVWRGRFAALRDALMGRRLTHLAKTPDGLRDLYRLGSVLGPPLRLRPSDTMYSPGLDWNTKNAAAIGALKARMPFRLTAACFDLIPWVYPRFYGARDVDVFVRYHKEAIRHTDRFIAISRCTASDLAKFALAHGLPVPDTRDEPLGADAGSLGDAPAVPLRRGLDPGRFVLFVSTIEPRKNHALLLRVWKRLAAGEGGGTNGFKMVFAGRYGWQTEDVMEALAADDVLRRDVRHIADATDADLHALYAGAAFCVYPSLYEGFGLPVVEAFFHGKPVITSTGGSLPEVAGTLAPCLDPADDDAWVEAIGRMLNDPALVAAQAQRVRAEFSWPTWTEAARRILAHARER